MYELHVTAASISY